MYNISDTDGPVGVLNDFDLATWVDHPTANNDRTGTIPFMAIDLLDGGLEDRRPRLYRHDMESFVWVLTYITVALIRYDNCTIKISPPPKVDTWFREDREAHILSKEGFYTSYGRRQTVFEGYYRYHNVVRRMIQYWSEFHQSLQDMMYTPRPGRPGTLKAVPENPAPGGPGVDDPADSLKRFVTMVESSLGEGGVGEGFAEVRDLLLEAIETPIVTTRTVCPEPA